MGKKCLFDDKSQAYWFFLKNCFSFKSFQQTHRFHHEFKKPQEDKFLLFLKPSISDLIQIQKNIHIDQPKIMGKTYYIGTLRLIYL